MVNIIGRILQVIALLAVFILNYFSNKKMGVSRYLAYKNIKFKENLFSEANLKFILLFLTLILLILIGLFIIKFFKSKNLSFKINNLFIVLFILITIVLITSKATFTLKVYYFLLIALFINLFIEFILLGIKLFKSRT